jgi:hypothetical protein
MEKPPKHIVSEAFYIGPDGRLFMVSCFFRQIF